MTRRPLPWNVNSLLGSGLLILLLAGYAALVYVTVVVLGLLTLGGPPGPWITIPGWLTGLAGVVIVATLWPVGRWLRHHVDDLVFGQHDDAYAVLSQINQQLREMPQPQLGLPAVVELLAGGLKLPYVALESTASQPPQRYASGQLAAQAALSEVPIAYLGQPLGRLLAAGRGAHQPLSASDRSLLHDVAQQVGVALYAAQLNGALRAAREQLVIAREEERRRIRNDLHDGLAPTLSALQLQLGALRKLVRQDPDQADALAGELREDLRQATAEIRRLVYDLRPPMLDELGLVAALRNLRFDETDLRLEVLAPLPMPPLSAAVEVAVYRIASEAIHNVVRHARATACVVDIAVDRDQLTLTVTDNGRQAPAAYAAGIGLQSMQERASELGGSCAVQATADGGTRVLARLPLGR